MSNNPSFTDTDDFTSTSRGFIAALEPPIITSPQGKPIWDLTSYTFLSATCPSTAHPNLWRQGQLTAKHGLYEICPGIYHIRGYDLSNMTIVEGASGIIVIDPLISCECSAAGLALYRAHRGHRKVTALVYSHSHGDHYMGAGGVLDTEIEGGKVGEGIPILAPDGFMEAVMSESILAGPAMRRRGAFMYGNALPRGPSGQIGTGLGLGSSVGTTSLIPPTVLIQRTGEEHVLDGVRVVFQMVPGSEAPAEINFFFPDYRALCVPETATNCMHNVVTLRGAQVRDAKAWSGYLDEAIVLFARDADVLFGSHHWPTWGREALVRRLEEQRDLYGYMHDQTVRMMNLGWTGVEIAERMRLPGRIERAWHCRGFYGSLSHNVKGIYQKYMTWFDGRPEHLWQYPPTEEGQRYVECFNGVDGLCDKAETFIQKCDYRFAATLLAHAVAADPDSTEPRAKLLLASVYEQLGFGAENATWRNFYLTSAQELRSGKKAGMVAGGRTALGEQLSIDQWLEILSVQLDGERGADLQFAIDFEVTDVGQRWRLIVSNGVLTRRLLDSAAQVQEAREHPADYEMVLTKTQLLEVIRGHEVKPERESGRQEVLRQLLELILVQEGSSRGPSQL
ncbi:Metallo-hydrolase/oxidoreductase [Aspergillus steynii IBT 23096]|uniref:Metallo-hydrolase/oxidoreductase n=1 Tax=Aspergillus steynii IBT 23096 TaxID=1392250 RepID=A0A2I2G197_9EURO|nr:Metallo-hydrolase/oxidoreductase [Aspergillus steynii IBT 23096]PLB46657.1 Metallo-hydrolase/oxidoreductase [Aspergillus steynii IBT 23096]